VVTTDATLPKMSLWWCSELPRQGKGLTLPNQQSSNVAILLATHNSGAFIDEQIRSLQENSASFTVHWLDDHSTDNTRRIVYELTARLGLRLVTWHQPHRFGVPGVFFKLLECVTADIYLFCDHDDIWQAGKIDAAVANLLPDVARPALCYSEPWVFNDGDSQNLRRYYDLRGMRPAAAQTSSRAFILNPAVGNTVGFTRPLRELYLVHKDIARTHAAMHDWWMYLLALTTGDSRMLIEVPTTLYRQHRNNALGVGFGRNKLSLSRVWRRLQHTRRLVARQAAGFVLAAANMKLAPAVEQMTAVARLIQLLDRRQTPTKVFNLLWRRQLQVPWRHALLLAAVSLVSDARD
jgi:glycosyltransferase involved in cell wall biosynthesis